MGLFYNPPQPHIGAAQPLEQRKLTPPSGPARDNPPFMGGSRVRTEVLNSWAAIAVASVVLPTLFVPAPAQANPPPARVADAIYRSWDAAPQLPQTGARVNPPIGGPAPQNPPFAGGAKITVPVLIWWIPPPPAPPSAVLLNPPISGPTPQNPPFAGGAKIPAGVAQWWLPAPPFPQVAPGLIPSAPAGAYTFAPNGPPQAILNSWFAPSPLPQSGARLTPPISGAAPQDPPFMGGAKVPQGILVWWIPPPPPPPVAKNLNPPIGIVTPDNPPIAGGARIPDSALVWWIAPPPQPPVAKNLNPPISGPAPQNPPFAGGASIPAGTLQCWIAPPPLPQWSQFGIPASPVVTYVPPALGIPAAVAQWWSLAQPAPLLPRLLSPPQSGPDRPPFVGANVPIAIWWSGQPQAPQQSALSVPQSGPAPQNPPFAGARVDQTILRWWAEPAAQVYHGSAFSVFKVRQAILPISTQTTISAGRAVIEFNVGSVTVVTRAAG